MRCQICTQKLKPIFQGTILKKYEIHYLKCDNCGFVTTEDPYWLNESYNEEIEFLDVGRVDRSINNRQVTSRVINNLNKGAGRFLDFGGGDGLFTRIMRDFGYDFHLFDPLSNNRYANFLEIEKLSRKNKYDMITSFEVFEHLQYPLKEIKKIFGSTDILLLSTECIPEDEKISKDWWYLVPESGQHISFYSEKTFKYICNILNLEYFRCGNYHLILKQKIKINPFKKSFIDKVINRLFQSFSTRRNSLVEKDFMYYKNKINV